MSKKMKLGSFPDAHSARTAAAATLERWERLEIRSRRLLAEPRLLRELQLDTTDKELIYLVGIDGQLSITDMFSPEELVALMNRRADSNSTTLDWDTMQPAKIRSCSN